MAVVLTPHSLDEHRRLEDQAVGLKELMHGKSVHAPLDNPKFILDIGCGTGIVTRELGRLYPSATVIGINVTPVPESIETPKNVVYIQGGFYELLQSDERLGEYFVNFCILLICDFVLQCLLLESRAAVSCHKVQ